MFKPFNNLSPGKKYSLLAALALFVAAVFYWQLWSAVPTRKGSEALVKILPGETMKVVAQKLEDQGLIRSSGAFSLYAKLKNLDNQLRPGRYQLEYGMGFSAILFYLTDPALQETSVTIPEGFSVHEIDERLAEKGLIEGGEFILKAQSMEGFLFPDTYSVYSKNFDPDALIAKMQANFIRKISPEMTAKINEQGKTLFEIVTMASILEREGKTPEDYELISGILWKRLKNNWPIQADATLLYGKTINSISAKDLTEDSPYNTRNRIGLPPTPIGNPGLATITAAIFPEESPYWFYLTDKDGRAHYAKTNEEHNENKRKYLGD